MIDGAQCFLLLLIWLMISCVGKYRPFTVDDFPRVSSDDDEQTVAVYKNPEISIRGPRPLRRFPAFKPESRHSCDMEYQLADESESKCFFN